MLLERGSKPIVASRKQSYKTMPTSSPPPMFLFLYLLSRPQPPPLSICCGSCILSTVESPYSPTFQTSPLSSIHSKSTILNPVVQIQKSESESKQTGLKAPILPSSLVRLFFLIPGCHSTQSRLLCRFPRVSTTLVILFVSSVVSS